MRSTGEEPSPAKVVAILRSFKRRLYFQVLRGMCLQVYLYAMYRGNVIAGRPPPASAASYGARLRGYGTGQACIRLRHLTHPRQLRHVHIAAARRPASPHVAWCRLPP